MFRCVSRQAAKGGFPCPCRGGEYERDQLHRFIRSFSPKRFCLFARYFCCSPFHPLRNTATLSVRTEDFLALLAAYRIEPLVIDFDTPIADAAAA
jgi:hypothetical protein